MSNFFSNPSYPILCTSVNEYSVSLSDTLNSLPLETNSDIKCAEDLFNLYFRAEEKETNKK